MAKAAKSIEPEIGERTVNKFVGEILERYAAIETLRGKFMLGARREREAMAAAYEVLAAKGVPQKSSKAFIANIRALERIKGRHIDLEADEQRMVQKLAKLQNDRRQLMLFGELPKQPKAERKPKANGTSATDLQEAEAAGSA